MLMKVAKKFRWEAAHRLPWHEGDCKNLHGHSYHMTIELEGIQDDKGIVIDFAHIKQIIKPLVDAWDHATLVAESDNLLLELLKQLDSKYFVLPFDSTSENLCLFVANYLQQKASDLLLKHRVEVIRVKIQETETCYAEHEHYLKSENQANKHTKQA